MPTRNEFPKLTSDAAMPITAMLQSVNPTKPGIRVSQNGVTSGRHIGNPNASEQTVYTMASTNGTSRKSDLSVTPKTIAFIPLRLSIAARPATSAMNVANIMTLI